MSGLTDRQLLDALTQLFKSTALAWVRDHSSEWSTWADFCKAVQKRYGTDRLFQQALRAEVDRRTQGEEEPFEDFITNLNILVNKLNERFDDRHMLELAYNNMLPLNRLQIRLDEISDIEELIDRVRNLEMAEEAKRKYRPPPLPENSLVPSAAYKPPSKPKKTPLSNDGISTHDPFAMFGALTKEINALKKELANIRPQKGQNNGSNSQKQNANNGQRPPTHDNRGSKEGQQGPPPWKGDQNRMRNPKSAREQTSSKGEKPPKPSEDDKPSLAALGHKRLSESEKSTSGSDSEGSEGPTSDTASVAGAAKGEGRKPRGKRKVGKRNGKFGKEKPGPVGKYCYICQKPGYTKYSCPDCKGNANGSR